MPSEEKILQYLFRCSDEKDINACEKCPYLRWGKESYGENKCKNILMQDAYSIIFPRAQLKKNTKKLSKLDAEDVVEFFSRLVRVKKELLREYGISDSNIATWAKKRSMPKLPKFVSVLKVLGYDIEIKEINNEK